MIRGGNAVLFVSDISTAIRFYVETLGMKLVEESRKAMVVDAGEGFRFSLEVGTARGALVFHPKIPLLEAIEILGNRGIAFDETGRFHDPDGNKLQLV